MAIFNDDFSIDFGQITAYNPSGATPGTAVITGGQLVMTAPGGGGVTGVEAGENQWPIAIPDLFASANLGSPTWQQPAQNQNNFGVGIIKDGSNNVWFAVGPANSSTTLILNVFGVFAGNHVVFANTTINSTVLPDAIGFGLQNNNVTCWMSFAGVWQQVTAIGAAGIIDVSGSVDFTVPGIINSWNPGSYWETAITASTPIAVAQLFYVSPFANPITGTTVPDTTGLTLAAAEAAIVAANLVVCSVTAQASSDPIGTIISQTPPSGTAILGSCVSLVVSSGPTVPTVNLQPKFVPAKCFLSVMVANPGDINPRIYPPERDTTVRVVPRVIV